VSPEKKNKKFTIRKTKLNTGQKRRREYEDNSFQPTKHQRIEGNRFKMIFSEDTIEFPMNLSPHTVGGGGVVSKRKRVSDACEIVNTELEEVRPKAKRQKIQCNEEETVDEIIKRGRKRSHYPLNKKLQAEFRRLSQEQRDEIYQKEEIKKMMEEYERKERQEREYEQHKAEIEKQKQETLTLKESLRKQREYEQQQQLHAEKK